MAVKTFPRVERSIARAAISRTRFASRGVVFVPSAEAPRGVGVLSKRLMDVAVGASLLVVLLPLLLVTAGLVRLDSAGPVLIGQARVGRGLRPFRIYKFRSMVAGA